MWPHGFFILKGFCVKDILGQMMRVILSQVGGNESVKSSVNRYK